MLTLTLLLYLAPSFAHAKAAFGCPAGYERIDAKSCLSTRLNQYGFRTMLLIDPQTGKITARYDSCRDVGGWTSC